jgi:hypothetical protein
MRDSGREQLPADQVTAEDEEEIDADPAEAIDATGRVETEKRGVVNDDDDDGEGAKKIETGLALTIGEARIDGAGSQRSEVRGQGSKLEIRKAKVEKRKPAGGGRRSRGNGKKECKVCLTHRYSSVITET